MQTLCRADVEVAVAASAVGPHSRRIRESVQMRIGMPVGLTLVLIGFIVACFTKDLHAFWNAALRPAPILFLILYFAGTAAMVMCGRKLDPVESRTNWIEQSCNTVAQGAFLVNMLLIYLKIR